jgi:hypothetical protein
MPPPSVPEPLSASIVLCLSHGCVEQTFPADSPCWPAFAWALPEEVMLQS